MSCLNFGNAGIVDSALFGTPVWNSNSTVRRRERRAELNARPQREKLNNSIVRCCSNGGGGGRGTPSRCFTQHLKTTAQQASMYPIVNVNEQPWKSLLIQRRSQVGIASRHTFVWPKKITFVHAGERGSQVHGSWGGWGYLLIHLPLNKTFFRP